MTAADDLEDYERRVQFATTALDEFAQQLLRDLDIDGGGGFRWWKGHSDWKRLALIADYLIASVQGASFALMAASLAADVARTNAVAESDALREAFAMVRSTKNPSIMTSRQRYRAIGWRGGEAGQLRPRLNTVYFIWARYLIGWRRS